MEKSETPLTIPTTTSNKPKLSDGIFYVVVYSGILVFLIVNYFFDTFSNLDNPLIGLNFIGSFMYTIFITPFVVIFYLIMRLFLYYYMPKD